MTSSAKHLADQGHTKAAATAYLAAYCANPDYPTLVAYAHAAANHDRPAVIRVIDEFMATADDIAKCKAMALQLPYLESEIRKANGLSEYSADDVDEPTFKFAEEMLWKWKRLAEIVVITGENRFSGLSAMAFAAHALGDYRDADRLLDIARHYFGDQRVTAAHFGGAWFDDLDDGLRRLELPKVFTYKYAPMGIARRVFIGCDEGYFIKHGAVLAKSLAGQDVCPHFHIYDPVGVSEIMDQLYELFGINFALTVEQVGGDERKYYYASARLIRMYKLMEGDNIPTVMLDAGLIVAAPLAPLFERLETHDVALCRMPGRIPFHTQFNASVVGINPRGGREFLKRVAGFIAKSYTDNCVPWCLDQISLLCTLREMQSRDFGPKTMAVGPQVYDGSLRDGVMLWPQKVTPDSEWYEKHKGVLRGLTGTDTACAS